MSVVNALGAAIGVSLSIPPLLQLIADYLTPFVGVVSTLARDHNGDRLFTPAVTTGTRERSTFDFVCEVYKNKLCKRSVIDGSLTPFIGGDEIGFIHGSGKSSRWRGPFAICADPIQSRRWYIADRTSVRCYNEMSDSVTLITGSAQWGSADGGPTVGAPTDGTGRVSDRFAPKAACFDCLQSLIITSDGRTLWGADRNNQRLRQITIATGQVESISTVGRGAGWFQPQVLVWDRRPSVPVDSALFAMDSSRLMRFVIATERMQPLETFEHIIAGAVSLPSGVLIVSSLTTANIYLFDPSKTGPDAFQALTGQESNRAFEPSCDGVGPNARFSFPSDLILDSERRCVWVSDRSAKSIRKLTLDHTHFPLAVCCDRDR